ncbi:2'-5' RNA ligase family protein [Alsobacter soli]|nr:2'-5' RNA ligase family protein [Alsobacter soli]
MDAPSPSGQSETAAGPLPLILTARFDERAQAWFEARRRAYYPADRNKVPAHLTLFHNLPGDQIAEVEDELAEECWRLDPVPARATHLRFTGQGVQVVIASPSLEQLRARLAERWSLSLTPQDLRPYRPHVTVQNKTSAENARRTFDAFCAVFAPFDCEIEGLDLWRYLSGPWDRVADFGFGAAPG